MFCVSMLDLRHFTARLFSVTVLLLLTVQATQAEPPRALPDGQASHDPRLGQPRDLNGYHPFHPVKSPAEWETRKSELRRQVLMAAGLWPLPSRTPLETVIHGRLEMPDYTIDKVYFQSFPGHFVTGNLYRPKNITGKVPGVLCPHGHFTDGRFTDAGQGKGEESPAVRALLAQGAERFVNGARSPLQARCVQLARMGCVVFHYDMIGYADSVQLEHRHGPRELPAAENGGWGLVTPQATAWLQGPFGIQTWNSVRALDFLLSLDEIDPQRVGVTGASGGGTQTMMIAAIDDRITAAFPAVMVSTAMQGGCPCENACYLRIGAGNIDIAACTAPRPLGLTTANDWTIELPTKGYPELQELYKMLGQPDRLTAAFLPQFVHNYNHVSRAAMYSFMDKHLALGQPTPVLERDFEFLPAEKLTVWNDDHPAPDASQRGDDHERVLLKWWADDAREQISQLIPSDSASLARYREVIGGAADVMLGRRLADVTGLDFELTDKQHRDDYLLMTGLVKNTTAQEELPAVFLYPENWNQQVVLWITPTGKAGLFDAQGAPRGEVARLLAAGSAVVGVDLVHQGELVRSTGPREKNPAVGPYREHPWGQNNIYTYGYNHPIFAQRVHDILTMLAFIREHERQPETVAVVGLAGAGHWVAAACAQAEGKIDRAVIDTAGFRFGQLTSDLDIDFLPGAPKYGDLPGLLSLAAPQRTFVAGESAENLKPVQATYQAAGAAGQLTLHAGPADEKRAVDWLLAP